MKPRTLILRTAGTNCERELAHAFELAGAECQLLHLNRLIENPGELKQYDLLGLPGGFSYGDDIAAGRIYANRLRQRLWPELRDFVASGRPVIGICNGFQLLVKCGLLPGFELPDRPPQQTATLADNALPRFTDQWVPLRAEKSSRCIWTEGLEDLELPIAHGEGRFLASEEILDKLEEQGQVALRYTKNPNGSTRDIAGICDPTGRVLGLMPHPERCTQQGHHFAWTRSGSGESEPAGLHLFRNAVACVQSQSSGV